MKRSLIKRISAIACAVVCAFTSGTQVSVNAQVATSGYKTQSYNWGNVQIVAGGYVPAIIFNEGEKDLMYARTDMGGAYRWDNAAGKWIPLTDWVSFDEWNLLGCESLAADPVETNRMYIAAGTYNNDWTKMNGYILRSQDKGNTFDRVELPFKFGGNMPGRGMGERLVIDPNDNKVIYFGARTGDGLWRSNDYGVTWSKVDNFPSVGTIKDYYGNEYGVLWVAFDTSSSTKGTPSKDIYVGVADDSNSIYHSADSGATWTALAGQPHRPTDWTSPSVEGFLPHHGILASNGMLYISYVDGAGPYNGDNGQLWKYDTKTGVWTDISPVSGAAINAGFGGLAVDKQNPDTIVVSTLNIWWPDENMYRSTDGGATWKPIWEWGAYPERNFHYDIDYSASKWLDWGANKSMPETNVKLGWMLDYVGIDPFDSNKMIYGTGATVYGTDNLTDWDKTDGVVHIKVKGQGIEETAVSALVSPTTPGVQLLSGLFDVNGFVHTDINVVPEKLSSVYTSSIDYAEKSPQVIVRVGNGGFSNAGATINIQYSIDGGTTWTYPTNSFKETVNGSDAYAEKGTVAVNADGGTILWSAENMSGAYYTTNKGTSWTKSTGLPAAAKVYSDRVNPDKFYGFKDGKFYISKDGGVTFTESAATELPTTGQFKAMAGKEGEIWLTGKTPNPDKTIDEPVLYGMWHSADGGATFTKVANVEEADTIGFGMAATGQDYMTIYTSAQIGGKRGIFRSDDKGETWIRINDDAHQYGSTDVAITGDPKVYGRVYLGTNGRGIVVGDIATGAKIMKDGKVIADGVIAEDNGSIIVAIDSNTIDKDLANLVEPPLPSTATSVETRVNTAAINGGAGSFEIITPNSNIILPIGIADYTGFAPGSYLSIKQNVLIDNAILQLIKGVNKVFEFTTAVYDSNGNKLQDIIQFNNGNKATITLKLTADDINGLDTNKLASYYYNDSTNKFEGLGGTFDSANNTFTFETSHFSNFVLAESIVEAPVLTTTGSPIDMTVLLTLGTIVLGIGTVIILRKKESAK
ncbi:WD40/YVTN/BNR-like repeat-containing protein [Clostridium cellulovorans]|uniref:Uncharacterized protein n=2 Tax=Clostridium cellulovorans TaxID=1493 RepID=D9SVS6_CLOC7|nr:sialidase family protein [Clostridium cellulovorans]ADL53137.1 hypothetical protein Clocel_3459 [Clostridium cellulovorans 743B]BAV13158.1 sialidase [Clostridium cellulovorans]